MGDELSSGSDVVPAGPSSPEPDVHGETAAAFAELSGETPSAPPAETPSDPSQAPADAITGDGAEVDETSPLARGPIPYDRHKAVLTNARNQTRAEVEREYQAKLQPLSWAQSVDPAEAHEALNVLRGLRSFTDKQQALSFIARQLGVTSDGLAQPQPADPRPEPDLVGENGIAVYSAEQMQRALDWQGRQWRQEWRKEVDESYGPYREKAVLGELRAMAQQQTTDVLTECRSTWDDFVPCEPDIKALMVADPNLSLERAYIRAHSAYTKKAQANLVKAADQDRASQLTRKAAAADSLRPGAPRPVTPRPDSEKTEREIAAEVFSSLSH